MSGEAERAQRRGGDFWRGIADQAGEKIDEAEAAGTGKRADRSRPDEGHGVQARCMIREFVEPRWRKVPEQLDQAP